MELKDIKKDEYFFAENPKTKDKNLLLKVDEKVLINCENGMFVEINKLSENINIKSVAHKFININVFDEDELIIYTIDPKTGTVISKQELGE